MTLKHALTAICDEPGCENTLAIDPQTTQAFLACRERGWKVQEDGESLTCPLLHTNELHGTLLIDGDGAAWLYNIYCDFWACVAQPEQWEGYYEWKSEVDEELSRHAVIGVFTGFDGGFRAIERKYGVLS